MRVYVAATVPVLADALTAAELPVGPAFAVTPALVAAYPGVGEDELEDEAREIAAAASLELVLADSGAPYRRVVVVLECAATPADTAADAILGAVNLAGPQPRSSWEAALLDVPGLAVGDGVEDRELLWYGVQELAHEL